jgi:hypothetical protein
MSPPFAIALSGLVFTLAVLTLGEFFHLKGAVPIAFLVGGTMMIGGLVVGLIRSILGKRMGE